MIIPFKGCTPLKRITSRKPNPHGVEDFVLVGPCGTLLDSEFFQDKEEMILSVGTSGSVLGDMNNLTEASVLRFVDLVPKGTT